MATVWWVLNCLYHFSYFYIISVKIDNLYLCNYTGCSHVEIFALDNASRDTTCQFGRFWHSLDPAGLQSCHMRQLPVTAWLGRIDRISCCPGQIRSQKKAFRNNSFLHKLEQMQYFTDFNLYDQLDHASRVNFRLT